MIINIFEKWQESRVIVACDFNFWRGYIEPFMSNIGL